MPKRVLVVDDDRDLREFITECLTGRLYEVHTASGGNEGCKKARELRPDLVILDLLMPDMHGYEVCETLRKDGALKGLKILISSAKQYEVDKRRTKDLGADRYIVKPFSIRDLLDAVKDLVGEA